jgi:hypothetical protein
MVELVHTISHRVARYLEKVGLVQRDMENSYLNLPVDDEDSLLQLQGAYFHPLRSRNTIHRDRAIPST